ncbi:MAG: hypothetical protein Q7T80_01100 [Methanoregula sp.]|nr:hypothetical protein [Methanoregula sp.]
MSIDFLVGFTIFMIAFIWVATLVPGLFIGLKSNTIDYDAVAYRTGVILVEDPGNPAGPPLDIYPWESLADSDKVSIKRFGLAVSKEAPNILDENKVDRFFNTTLYSYSGNYGQLNDYRPRLIFGDYPYRFNISLKAVGEDTLQSVGDVIPVNYPYGYIRRDVKIKGSSNTTIDNTMIVKYHYNNMENVTFPQTHRFTIQINGTKLLSADPAYQINPQKDRIIINITDLNAKPVRPLEIPAGDPGLKYANVNLTKIEFFKFSSGVSSPLSVNVRTPELPYLYVDGKPVVTSPSLPLPISRPGVKENISMIFGPSFFNNAAPTDTIYVNLTFGLESTPDYPQGQRYLNNTMTNPFNYDYNPVNVTQPQLKDAVLEVAVW